MALSRLREFHSALAAGDTHRALSVARSFLGDGEPKPSILVDYVQSKELELSLLAAKGKYNEADFFKAFKLLDSSINCSLSAQKIAKDYIYSNFHGFVCSELDKPSQQKPIYEPYLSYLQSAANKAKDRPSFFLPKSSDPMISILLPVYQVKTEYLARAILSVLRQTYPRWQLCVYFGDKQCRSNQILLDRFQAIDDRIMVSMGPNLGISGNSDICLSLATGQFISLLDHDDILTELALEAVVKCIRKHPHAEFIYTDKDSVLANGCDLVNPLFKPDWSPEMLYSANYLTHFNVIQARCMHAIGGFDPRTDGAQDWDLFLKVTENSKEIYSIKEVCYHWRIHPGSTAVGLQVKPYAHNGQLLAINNHLQRRFGNLATAEANSDSGFHVIFAQEHNSVHKNRRLLCLVYGAPSTSDLLAQSLSEKSKYGRIGNYTFLVCHSGLPVDVVHSLRSYLGAHFCEDFETIVLVNADLEGVTIQSIDEIAQWTVFHPDIGFCAGLVVDSGNCVLDCGICFDSSGKSFSPFAGLDLYNYGVFGSQLWYRNWLAANGLFLAVKSGESLHRVLEELEHRLDCQEDNVFIWLTFLLSELGLRGMTNPHARLIYSRQQQTTPNDCWQTKIDLQPEATAFLDPYFHPHIPLLLDSVLPDNQSVQGRIEPSSRQSLPGGQYFDDALVLAEVIDITPSQLAANRQNPRAMNPKISSRKATWFLPDFTTAFYGGVMTVLRLASFLKLEDGIESSFVICGDTDVVAKQSLIAAAFPALANCSVMKLVGSESLLEIPNADYGIATLWTTAYVLAATNACACKFYMIQDYEPLFYPAGSTYAQCEATYKFGFYGIANTQSLAEMYRYDYQGEAVCLVPSVDTSIFYANPRMVGNILPFRICYYARPSIPRNCFELASAAFKLIKNKYGGAIEILCAGSGWDPSLYGLENIVSSFGLLPYEETADLYRSCHLGISMMMSKHPSYLPLEMMACGLIVLANDNDANSWLLKDEYNCLTFTPTKSCLADRVVYAYKNYHSLSTIRENAINTIRDHHSSWQASLQVVAAFMHTAGREGSPEPLIEM